MPRRRTRSERESVDEFGLDDRGGLSSRLADLVPATLARRGVVVSVDTDRPVYERDDPVEITVEFENRLPVPIAVPTPKRRLWGWTVDGHLEASDERLYTRSDPSTFDFRGGERKRVSVVWNGRLERTDGIHESVVPEPGEYEITAFVATHPETYRPSDSTTVRIR